MNRFFSKIFLVALTLIIAFATNEADAQVPYKVRYFNASQGIQAQPGVILLEWMPDYSSSAAQVKGFYLYQREIIQNSFVNKKIAKFELNSKYIDSIRNASGNYYISSNSGNTWLNMGLFYNYGSNFPGDTMYCQAVLANVLSNSNNGITLFMTAYGDFGESQHSNAVTLQHYKDSNNVHFTSQPPTQATVGELYEYTAVAEASSKATITYSINTNGNTGMTINSETGLMQWTPWKVGTYYATITAKATFENGSIAYANQYVSIIVKTCKSLVRVIGEVVDENGKPVEFGMAYAYRHEDAHNDSMFVTSGRISNGIYQFMLDAGSYIIYFATSNYHEGVWYENSEDGKNPTVVFVKCGENITLNKVVMKSIKTPQYYGVTGQVIDATTKLPIPYAYVRFISTDDNQIKAFTASTNQSGYYQLSLPNTYTYIANATAVKDTMNNLVNYYIPQYFKLTNEMAQAEKINLTSSRNDINFALEQMPNYQNAISGKVLDKDNIAQANCYVIAYLVDQIKNSNYSQMPVRTAYSDATGAFNLHNLYPGKYVLLCVPPLRQNSAGYYKEGEFIVQSWNDATQISVSAASMINDIKINIIKKQSIPGNSTIEGVVTGEKSLVLKNSDNPQSINPVNGAIVYLLDNKNQVIDYSITNKNGQYQILNVAEGNYKILADRVGFGKEIKPVVIVENTFLDVKLNSNDISDVSADLDNIGLSIFPNPSKDIVNINSKNNDNFSVVIRTLLGNTIENYNNINGNLSINLKDYSTGAYMITIIVGQKEYTTTIVKE